jgi:thioredoxin 1|tara:strand:- start:12 stop:434 length:423 start_codon:yes stop_codon:yes gene_type:complete
MSDNEILDKSNPTPESTNQSHQDSIIVSKPKEETLGSVIKATDENFEQLIKNEKPILIDFWANWCSPCKVLAPILDEISKEMVNDITIAKLNIDNDPNTPTKFSIRGIPTMIIFKNGEVKSIKNGVTTKSNIVSWIKENI